VGQDGTTRVHDGVVIRWTFDERIHDGFYAAATLELLRSLVEDPQKLLVRSESEPATERSSPPLTAASAHGNGAMRVRDMVRHES
jgi:hypothetical protein